MKRTFLFALVMTGLSICARAQQTNFVRNNINLRIGPELAFPIGNLNKTQGAGVGASALLDLPVLPRLSVILYAGAMSLSGDRIGGSQSVRYTRTNMYPIRTGINYKFTPAFYGTPQLGRVGVNHLGNKAGGVAQSLGIGLFTGRIDAGLRWDHNYVHGGLSSINAKLGYVLDFRRNRR